MKIPGVAITALITVLSGWLATYFGEWQWTATAIVVLGAVAKLVEMSIPKPQPPVGALGAPMPAERANGVARFLLG